MNRTIESMGHKVLHLTDTRFSCLDKNIKSTEHRLFFKKVKNSKLCNQALAFFYEINLVGNLSLTLLSTREWVWGLITTGGNETPGSSFSGSLNVCLLLSLLSPVFRERQSNLYSNWNFLKLEGKFVMGRGNANGSARIQGGLPFAECSAP